MLLRPGTWPLYVLMTGNVSRVVYRAMATGQNANISLKTRYSIKTREGNEMLNELEKEKNIPDWIEENHNNRKWTIASMEDELEEQI